MERKFSYIYSELVDGENDMIGHIAYSLYKSNKIKFIEQFKSENSDKTPTEDELHAYHKAVNPSLPALRIQAEQILSNFTQLTMDETVFEIEADIKNNQEKALRDIITPLIPQKPKGPWAGFWMGVLVKFVQGLVLAIILFFLIFASSAKDDFWGTIRNYIPEGHTTNTQSVP